MKKLNKLNRVYLVVLILLTVATAIKIVMYQGWKRYYYGASVSAPSSYPIRVNRCEFILANGETAYLGTTQVNDQNSDWGDGDYSDPHRKERLPVALVIDYADYRSQQFYRDSIILPEKVISETFKNELNKGEEVSQYQSAPVMSLNFVVGVANNGNIIVWLRGKSFEKVLVKHKANIHEPKADDTWYERRLSRKGYFNQAFNIDSAQNEEFKKGFDKHANYIDTPSRFKTFMMR